MIRLKPVCFDCKHFDKETSTCAAFLEEIPMDILDGTHDHKTPHEGNNGIQFEPIGPQGEG